MYWFVKEIDWFSYLLMQGLVLVEEIFDKFTGKSGEFGHNKICSLEKLNSKLLSNNAQFKEIFLLITVN